MHDLVLFGIQGSGKGTQGHFLADTFPEFSYFSSGEVFRALVSNDNALKEYFHQRMSAGDLVEDSVANSLFELYLNYLNTSPTKKYFLLDGYPRNIMQLAMMMTTCQRHNRKPYGIHFVLSDEIAIQRMLARKRPDDTLEVVKHRIALYHELTVPILDMFRKIYPFTEIDANQSIEKMQSDVRAVVEQWK